MELRQLEYFIAVASEMNFSRAAQRVHVVQSALSTSVSKLEKELGVELFDRSRQQIKMTPAGELFREHARRVIHTARTRPDERWPDALRCSSPVGWSRRRSVRIASSF